MIQISKNEVEAFNKIVSNIIYMNGTIPKIEKYQNVILLICKNLEDLSILKVNLRKREYEYNFPNFICEKFLVNIFYLFPQDYSLPNKKAKFYEEYIDIFFSGLELFKNDYLCRV
jgi:hypothetical protein